MLVEAMSAFFGDFGVPVEAGGQTATAILDMPSEIIAQGMVISTDYQLTYATADLALTQGQSIKVDGKSYYVREVRLQDDGAISIAYLGRP